MNVLILGAGYSGTAIASALAPLAMSVSGTTRAAESSAACRLPVSARSSSTARKYRTSSRM